MLTPHTHRNISAGDSPVLDGFRPGSRRERLSARPPLMRIDAFSPLAQVVSTGS